jgi:hypothetical protein
MADARLPRGWTLHIRDVSGDRKAVALNPDRPVEWVGFEATRCHTQRSFSGSTACVS